MPASPADIDVFEIRKLQQYLQGYNISLVQSDLRRIGLLLMYNRYNLVKQSYEVKTRLKKCIKKVIFNLEKSYLFDYLNAKLHHINLSLSVNINLSH
jgi:hypothetical protein